MNILLLGKHGQLGWELQRTLAPLGNLTAMDFPEIDLSQPETIRPLISQVQPDVIMNATAYTAVDRAENETELAYAINEAAPRVMAEEASEIKAVLVHYSTDYVFDGNKGSPYVEEDIPEPLGVYGNSKLAGEKAVQEEGGVYLILRTSWVYSLRRDSFVTKVLQWARQNPELKVVSDQVSNPTWARMLAEISAQLLARAGKNPFNWLGERRGIYHLAGSGYTSRLEWAKSILRCDPKPEEQVIQQILPALTAEFPTPAQRPLFSALNCDKFNRVFGLTLPGWEESLHLAMESG